MNVIMYDKKARNKIR